jgi:hypothetical protein
MTGARARFSLLSWASLALAFGTVRAMTPEQAEQKVLDALRRGDTIPAQAQNLIELAWPKEGPADPVLSARARKELVDFGIHAIVPLRANLTRLAPAHQADAVRAFIEARERIPGPTPPDFVPGLEEVLWFGTREAKRIAMREVARYRSPHAVLPIVDSALEDPALLPDAVAALGEIGSARARFFLAQVFHEGQPALREQAASALARIGGSALEPLREALRAPSREERLVAVRALLAVAGEDDLSALYEYLANHPDDDPPTTAAVRTAAERIEQELEARRAAEAASGSPESF